MSAKYVEASRKGRSRTLRVGGGSLRGYFVLLVLVFTAAAVAAIVHVNRAADRHARSDAATEAAFAARTAATQLGNHLSLLQATVAQLAANPGIAGVFSNPSGCSLAYQGLGGPDRGHIDIVGADGAVLCSSRKADDEARSVGYAGSAWLRSALSKSVFEAPVPDRVTAATVAVAAVPIPGGKGVVAGFADLFFPRPPAGRALWRRPFA